MKQYLDLLRDISENGVPQSDRTGVGTRSVFGRQLRFNMLDGFPLLTTKRIKIDAIIHELLWFLSGDTNIRYLLQNDVHIWSEWPHAEYMKAHSLGFPGAREPLTLKEFEQRVIEDENGFSSCWGGIGLGYGKQWRSFTSETGSVDQISNLINGLKTNPFGRRHIVSAWNAAEIEYALLPPCHMMFQLRASKMSDETMYRLARSRPSVFTTGSASDFTLDLQIYIRSSDTVLGLPFNIASYALLLMMIAQQVEMVPNDLIVVTGDSHIYSNHADAVVEQLSRSPRSLPYMEITKAADIFSYKRGDFELQDYDSYPPIKAPVAV